MAITTTTPTAIIGNFMFMAFLAGPPGATGVGAGAPGPAGGVGPGVGPGAGGSGAVCVGGSCVACCGCIEF